MNNDIHLMGVRRNPNASYLEGNKITVLRANLFKKKLKRIDMEILQRILLFLYYNSKTKKTNIAMKCGMSYDKCILYLDWMKTISLVKNELNQGFELVSLSERGIEFFEKNFKHD